MQKLSAEEKIRVLADVPEALRKLAAERDYYQKELLKRASDERLKKLAST